MAADHQELCTSRGMDQHVDSRAVDDLTRGRGCCRTLPPHAVDDVALVLLDLMFVIDPRGDDLHSASPNIGFAVRPAQGSP
jgi:hypothetical protein